MSILVCRRCQQRACRCPARPAEHVRAEVRWRVSPSVTETSEGERPDRGVPIEKLVLPGDANTPFPMIACPACVRVQCICGNSRIQPGTD